MPACSPQFLQQEEGRQRAEGQLQQRQHKEQLQDLQQRLAETLSELEQLQVSSSSVPAARRPAPVPLHRTRGVHVCVALPPSPDGWYGTERCPAATSEAGPSCWPLQVPASLACQRLLAWRLCQGPWGLVWI